MRPINLHTAKDYPVVSGQLHQGQTLGLQFIQDWLKSDKPYAILAGYAGTGKSYLTGGVVKLLQHSCWGSIGVTAPTHQARLELQRQLSLHGVNLQSTMISVATIHAWLGLTESIDDDGKVSFVPQGVNKSKYRDGCDVLIVDEASMVDQKLNGYIDEAWDVFKGRILFVGDPLQIPPIGEKESAPFLQYTEGNPKFYGAHILTDIVRQAVGNPIIRMAGGMREFIESERVMYRFPNLSDYVEGDRIRMVSHLRTDICRALYLSQESLDNPRYVKALAYRNDTVDGINVMVKAARHKTSIRQLPWYMPGETFILTEPLMDGDTMILPNNAEITIESSEKGVDGEGEYRYAVHTLTVSSELLEKGTTVIIKPKPKDAKYTELTLLLLEYAKMQRKGSVERSAAWREYYGFIRQYVPIKMSFAITAHRSQGSTYQHTIIDEIDIFSNRNKSEGARVAYTALTRAAEGVVILRNV